MELVGKLKGRRNTQKNGNKTIRIIFQSADVLTVRMKEEKKKSLGNDGQGIARTCWDEETADVNE
jgi:hypothetical protein